MIHVYPVNDTKPHDLESAACPCGPRVEFWHPVTGQHYSEGIVIHRAWDAREVVEEAEELWRTT